HRPSFPPRRSSDLSTRVGNPSDAPTARDVVAGWLALPEGYAPTPSLAGARSRQLSLSKIVPYDFVEPSSTRVGNPSDAPTARDVVAGCWRSQRDSNPRRSLERAVS